MVPEGASPRGISGCYCFGYSVSMAIQDEYSTEIRHPTEYARSGIDCAEGEAIMARTIRKDQYGRKTRNDNEIARYPRQLVKTYRSSQSGYDVSIMDGHYDHDVPSRLSRAIRRASRAELRRMDVDAS